MLLVTVTGCFFVPSPWNGAWKLDSAKSSMPLETFTLVQKPSGEYHWDRESVGYDFRCDGKDYPSYPGYSVSCLPEGDRSFQTTTKRNGVKIADYRWDVSADGKTLTIAWDYSEGKGPSHHSTRTYDRLSGDKGLAGAWRDTKPLELRPQFLQIRLGLRTLRFAYPQARQITELTLDGADAPVRSPSIASGFTMAIRPQGDREFATTFKSSGRIIHQGTLELSADGRTLTDTWWRPGQPDRKTVLVYQKQ